jgi:hypothetical protein
MAGPYTIATPITNTPVPSALFGQAVKDAINDLHTRTAALETGAQSILARGRRTTSVSPLTSAVGVLRIDNVPIKAGRLYRISTSNLNFYSTVANDIGNANIRIFYQATVGGVATIANSTAIGGMRNVVDVAGSTSSNTVPCNAIYAPTADGYVSVLLSAARAAGTGTMTLYAAVGEQIDFTVEYSGIDPGDTGVIL